MRIREWYRHHGKGDKDWFEGLSGALGFQIILVVAAIVVAHDDPAYYRAHGALMLVAIMLALVMVVRRASPVEMANNAWRFLSHNRNATLNDASDFVLITMLLVSLMSLAFVVDYAFIGGGGFRISAVVAVSLIPLVKAALVSFSK